MSERSRRWFDRRNDVIYRLQGDGTVLVFGPNGRDVRVADGSERERVLRHFAAQDRANERR